MSALRSIKPLSIVTDESTRMVDIDSVDRSTVLTQLWLRYGDEDGQYDSVQERDIEDEAEPAPVTRERAPWLMSIVRVACAMSLMCAALFTIAGIHRFYPLAHAPVVLVLLPILAASLLFGRSIGLATTLLSLAAVRSLYYPIVGYGLGFKDVDDLLSFSSLGFAAVGACVVALYANGMKTQLDQNRVERHTFNREVLLAVTSGRLMLCEDGEISRMVQGAPVYEVGLIAAEGLASMRHRLCESLCGQVSPDKLGDLTTCVTEAATNALKYAGGASVKSWVGAESVSVVVSDRGCGIAPSLLARATLERGFSTQQTLGMGFTLMLGLADKIALHTSPRGTDVLIELRTA